MGGWSVEREVSLVSGEAVAQALAEQDCRVSKVDVGRDIAARLAELEPDVVFNALHGRYGEDGCVQGLLEVMNIPYTHSGVLASALAMNKPLAKDVFHNAGITCPEGVVTRLDTLAPGKPWAPPIVIKPINEGSSVGVRIVLEGENWSGEELAEWSYGDDVLIERFIPGREIQVAVMGERALGAIEIRPKGRFYDYDTKYTEGMAEHVMPAPLAEADYAEALRISLLAHKTLGCRGVTRADLRYDDTNGTPGRFYLLEVNTQPGMTPLSLVPEIAAHAGISFGALVASLVEEARCDG
jgi:D-alanine-D-alanine ligase